MKRYPLSKTEYGIYIEQVTKGGTAYNLPVLVPLSDNVELDRLESAIAETVKRHPSLLTSFGVDETGEVYRCRRFDAVKTKRITADSFDPYDYVAPFDLHSDCLCRIYIVSTPEKRYLFFDIHHIVFDGTSSYIVLSEIDCIYNGGTPAQEILSAAEFAEEEQRRINSEEYTAAKREYKSVFDGVDTDTSFFTDKNDREPVSKEVIYNFETVDSPALKALAQTHGVKLSTVFNAAFAYLLAQYTNSEQVLYSTFHHGRDERLQNTVGMFVKTYPVLADISNDTAVGDYLKTLDAHITRNRRNDLYAFADFCADFRLNPSVLFAYQGDLFTELDFCGGRSKVFLLPVKDAKSGFELTVRRADGRFIAFAEYDQSLYDDDVVRTMLESYDKILCDLLSAERLADINMLTGSQLEKLDSCNHFEFDYEITDIVTMFRRQVEKTPDNTAVVYLDCRYTYREVDRLTENIAAFLKSKGVGKNNAVSVLIPRCEYMPIAALGIHKAGAGYQPLDPSYPSERLEFMIQDADAKYLIADRSLMDRIPNYDGPVIYTDKLPGLPYAEKIPENPAPEDLFIMLYTSGSTGVPKGVMLEHRNLCCFCNWYINTYHVNETSRASAYASYGFDCHMLDMYPVLLSGGQLHIIDEDIRLDLTKINKYFRENGITHTFMTTQVGRQYAELFPDAENPHHLSAAGEKLVPVEPPRGFKLYNGYGPTECTIFTHMYPVEKLYDRVPIGYPLFNMKQYVVDKQLRRVPIGVPGELVVAGHQVGRGYLNRPEKNAEVFIRNPFSDEPGYERAYRTGDIVRLLSNGVADFIGRNDGQVKIRGFRIELSEVEGVIRKFPGIKDATVQAFDEPGGGKFIAAYVVSDEPVDVEALGEFIRRDKPAYMVPAVTMQLDRIPLNQNQKVNKRALPVPEKKQEDVVPPQNDTQQKIFDCIADVIGTTSFGITTDIFDAGLTSIGSIKLNVLLSSAFDVPVSSKDLREHSTVAALERFFGKAAAAESYDILPDYPITQTQNGIFIECVANPGSTIYNIPYLFRLSDKIDLNRLKSAVEAAIDAHPYLKTELFMNDSGDIRAKRNDSAAPSVEMIEADALPEDMVQPFELLNAPLYRVRIFKTPNGSYLFMEFHHIICDGTSEAVILEDINAAYDGKALTAEEYTGFEAALDEQKARASEQYEKAKQYYDKIFDGADADLLPAGDVSGREKASGQFTVTTDIDIQPIRDYCAAHGVTENAFFNAVFAFVLGKYSYKNEAVYTTIYHGRNDSRLARSVTMLVKTFPVYCALDGDTTVADLIRSVGEQLINSMSHDIYSFAEISAAYDIPADIMFAYQGDSFAFDRIGSEPAEMRLLTLSDAKAPLNINVFVKNGRVEFVPEYRADKYSERFMTDFVQCLAAAAREFTVKAKLRQVSLMTREARSLIDGFNATEVTVPRTTCNRLFEEQVRLNPDKTAVIADGVKLSYTELNEAANRVANSLIACGSKVDEMIGVMMPRTVYAYTAREGILKAGGAFMPLAPDYPDDRVSYILENSGAKNVVTTVALAEERMSVFEKSGVAVHIMEELLQCEDTSDPDTGVQPENLCYCIYTSGSTGKPKGVMIEHHSLVNFVHHDPINVQSCEFADNMTVSLALAALTFDVSVLEESLGLYHGGTVAMATEDEINNPLLLADMIRKNGVDVMKCTPSYMNNLLDVPQAVDALRQMKAIDIGAEAFPAPLYNKMRAAGITAKIHNGYGPTEATITTSIDYLTSDRITIGKPLCNTKVVMLDKFDNELPVNVPGELTILGECVGRGYVANEKLTKEKFITFNGLPAYRSGDLARFADDGKIIFMGRMDNQVKLRGLRIELDEIENVMNSYPSVQRSVVLVREDKKAGQYLCAYFTASEEVDTALLSAHIGKSLAKYMVPSVFIQLDAIPLTANGKVDKKALPEPELKTEEREYVAPVSALQKQLCDIFAYALGAERVGINENFFEIGGTSLSASKIAVKAMTENLPIAFKDIFDYPTVAEMEKYISSVSSSEAEQTEDETADISPALAHNVPKYVDEIRAEDIGNVLLTGATGFLGVHVLKRLIDSTDKTVYCLLRGENTDDKLKNILMYYFDTPHEELFGSRIITVCGDITDRDGIMALKAVDFSTVINCAACVKHFTQDDTLDRINWHGVENLIDLCAETNRRLVQVSTVSVAGESVNGKFSVDRVIRENELYFGQSLENKYVYTKFKAEEALLKAVEERGLDGKIVRVGNLMSRYSDGEFQINSVTNNFMRSLRAYAALKTVSVAALDSAVEFSPIDCTAAAMVTLAGANRDFTVFHATNGHRVQMGDVIEAMNRVGVPVEIVDKKTFDEMFGRALADDSLNELISPLISYQASDKNTVEFYIGHNNDFTTKALYRLGFKWPIINEDYLKNVFEALETLAFFDV